jgi:hypothetical protein
MADPDSPHTEEDSDGGPNESQWQIPFDAAASVGWAESTTEKESRTAEVSSPPTWGGLMLRGYSITIQSGCTRIQLRYRTT